MRHAGALGTWGWCPCASTQPVSLCPRKGRRPTLILRTQLSVRVHAIIGELGGVCSPLGPGIHRTLRGFGVIQASSKYSPGECKQMAHVRTSARTH